VGVHAESGLILDVAAARMCVAIVHLGLGRDGNILVGGTEKLDTLGANEAGMGKDKGRADIEIPEGVDILRTIGNCDK
jgi:hypothetical protein